LELRSVDPTANPYLIVAAMLEAGLDGIRNQATPAPAVDRNIYRMDDDEREANQITDLPSTLHNALKALEADEVLRTSLGNHLYPSFMESKRLEWASYRQVVSQWERDQYLEQY
jgi:glutamine synthetase